MCFGEQAAWQQRGNSRSGTGRTLANAKRPQKAHLRGKTARRELSRTVPYVTEGPATYELPAKLKEI